MLNNLKYVTFSWSTKHAKITFLDMIFPENNFLGKTFQGDLEDPIFYPEQKIQAVKIKIPLALLPMKKKRERIKIKHFQAFPTRTYTRHSKNKRICILKYPIYKTININPEHFLIK